MMDEGTLRNRVVVVTGGARRVGRAIALECARRGASVAITFRSSQAEARSCVEEMRALGGDEQRFESYELEVTDSQQIQRLARDIETDFGGATALINNASIFQRTPWSEVTEADFDAHIGANLRGPFLLCKYLEPQLSASRAPGGGCIVNLGDIYGSRPLKNYAPYCVSKAGLLMLTQVLALALAPRVRVNALCPGTVLPPSTEQGEGDDVEVLRRRIPLERLGGPGDAARAAAFLLEEPFLSGVALPIDGAQRLR